MPILWGDRLVARVDPRLDRSTGTLVINGLWLEDPALARDDAFAAAMQRGTARFRAFHEAKRLDVAAVPEAVAPAAPRRAEASQPEGASGCSRVSTTSSGSTRSV